MNRTLENVGSGLDVNDITAGLVGQRPDLCVSECVFSVCGHSGDCSLTVH